MEKKGRSIVNNGRNLAKALFQVMAIMVYIESLTTAMYTKDKVHNDLLEHN